MQLGLRFWGSKALLSAVELGLFTTLARGPLTGETLTAKLGLQPRGTTDWLDALVSLGMLKRAGDLYANTGATDLYLDRAKPTYVGGMLEMANARLYPFWGSLTEGLRTGRPQNEAKNGGDFFAALYQDQARLRQFLHAMTGLSLGAAVAIAETFPGRSAACRRRPRRTPWHSPHHVRSRRHRRRHRPPAHPTAPNSLARWCSTRTATGSAASAAPRASSSPCPRNSARERHREE